MRVKLSDLTKYSKGVQINGDDLIDNGKYIYLNGGINPSGRWNEANVGGNTITISEGGNSSGYVNYLTEPFWCGAHCYYLYDGPKNTRYLYYALKSQQERLFHIRSGACMPNIKKADLGKFEFEFNLDENKQEEVVSALSLVESIIDERKSELVLLDNIIKARFVEMFGDPVDNPKHWAMIELGSLTNIGSSKRIFEKEYVSEGVPFYRTKEIVELSKGNVISTELYISDEKYSEIKKQYGVPKAGDLLISAVGTIGVIWIVDGKNDFYFKDGNIIRINKSDNFDSIYMKALLENLITEYKKQMSTGTAYAALTISGLTNIKVYDVPIELQKQFANFVAQVDKSKFVKINLVIYDNII